MFILDVIGRYLHDDVKSYLALMHVSGEIFTYMNEVTIQTHLLSKFNSDMMRAYCTNHLNKIRLFYYLNTYDVDSNMIHKTLLNNAGSCVYHTLFVLCRDIIQQDDPEFMRIQMENILKVYPRYTDVLIDVLNIHERLFKRNIRQYLSSTDLYKFNSYIIKARILRDDYANDGYNLVHVVLRRHYWVMQHNYVLKMDTDTAEELIRSLR